jgi:hypothetical protein
MGSRRRLRRRVPSGDAGSSGAGVTGTTTLRAALTGRARSRPGHPVQVPRAYAPSQPVALGPLAAPQSTWLHAALTVSFVKIATVIEDGATLVLRPSPGPAVNYGALAGAPCACSRHGGVSITTIRSKYDISRPLLVRLGASLGEGASYRCLISYLTWRRSWTASS